MNNAIAFDDTANNAARRSTMNSSEAENFDLDNVSGSESDDYSPPAKTIVSIFVPLPDVLAACSPCHSCFLDQSSQQEDRTETRSQGN